MSSSQIGNSVTVNNYRLFDCVATQINKGGFSKVMSIKRDNKWVAYNTNTVDTLSQEIATGLLASIQLQFVNGDVEKTDKIAIISSNCPEWVLVDLAVQQTGCILVPLYPTTIPAEIVQILNETKVKIIFANSEPILKMIIELQKQIPSLQIIYSMDDGLKHEHNLTTLRQQRNEETIKQLNQRKKEITDEHIATIIYTSGTIGVSKGVILNHKNIISTVFNGIAFIPLYPNPDMRYLSFLPMNHVFEKMLTYICMFNGYQIYYAESLEKIAENIKEVKPQVIAAVPRLLEKIYTKIVAKGDELTGLKRKLFFWSLSIAEQFDFSYKPISLYAIKLWIARKLVLSKMHEALGGNIYCMLVGGSALPEKLIRIFNGAGIYAVEGYGATENIVISTNRVYKQENLIGTVGQAMQGVQIKLNEEGEICIQSDSLMKGYYQKPEQTNAAIVNGWYHTGDIGEWIKNDQGQDYLKIIGRKAESFKTKSAKFVLPVSIEMKLLENPLFNQAIILGENRDFVVTLIVPSFSNLIAHLNEHHDNKLTTDNYEQLIKDPVVIEIYSQYIEAINKVINPHEKIRNFTLLPREWTTEKGELTPKLSLRRKVILKQHEQVIEKMYQEGKKIN
ncbi:MAG: AMP-binding protein [Phycisphaerales bacterium]|nr:AMP-binding protein [Phycisphaerales bacterium]